MIQNDFSYVYCLEKLVQKDDSKWFFIETLGVQIVNSPNHVQTIPWTTELVQN